VKVLVQWTLAEPGDWEEIEVTRLSHWRGLPRKPEPAGGEPIDNERGWLYGINVQGVLLHGMDHYSVRPLPGGSVEVTRWNDDPEDWPGGTRYAQVWTFHALRPDQHGNLNTHQELVVYAEDQAMRDHWAQARTTGGAVEVRPWSDFVVPDARDTIHGVWMSDELDAAHQARQSVRGWREWAV
jgi:hypothetical protein